MGNGNGADENGRSMIVLPPQQQRTLVLPAKAEDRGVLLTQARAKRLQEEARRAKQKAGKQSGPAASGHTSYFGGSHAPSAAKPKKKIPEGVTPEYRSSGGNWERAGYEQIIRPTYKKPVIARMKKEENTLRFSPYAWSKLVWFRDRGDTEIAGFGVSPLDDLLYMEDFITIPQYASTAFVEFDDDAVNAYLMDMCANKGYKPEQCLRIWLHTHPGNSASPSGTDHKTFGEAFGGCDWAIMFILAKGGETHCKLRYNVGPGCVMDMKKPMIDYSPPFRGVTEVDYEEWEREYCKHVLNRKWEWIDYEYEEYDQWKGRTPEKKSGTTPRSYGSPNYWGSAPTTVSHPRQPRSEPASHPTVPVDSGFDPEGDAWDECLGRTAWRDVDEIDDHDYLLDEYDKNVKPEGDKNNVPRGSIIGVDDWDVYDILEQSGVEMAEFLTMDSPLPGGPQIVESVSLEVNIVVTESHWYEYDTHCIMYPHKNQEIDHFSDITNELPIAMGKCYWVEDKHGDKAYWQRSTEVEIRKIEGEDLEEIVSEQVQLAITHGCDEIDEEDLETDDELVTDADIEGGKAEVHQLVDDLKKLNRALPPQPVVKRHLPRTEKTGAKEVTGFVGDVAHAAPAKQETGFLDDKKTAKDPVQAARDEATAEVKAEVQAANAAAEEDDSTKQEADAKPHIPVSNESFFGADPGDEDDVKAAESKESFGANVD